MPIQPNDIGAHVGEHHGAKWSRADGAQFDDPIAVQRAHAYFTL